MMECPWSAAGEFLRTTDTPGRLAAGKSFSNFSTVLALQNRAATASPGVRTGGPMALREASLPEHFQR